ncbi:sortase [Actinotalea ferrariae CF5-4]|uniref:Sortase n=1 Tax=Actinotalea ferrariae CF5-4 TaxID=948458 RepID=A0A021VUM9_9CELL|nr:class E sortase [Actinotalea ferrariae]EYR64846.1 sortase [Actinotalea ferrariae CF5-4]
MPRPLRDATFADLATDPDPWEQILTAPVPADGLPLEQDPTAPDTRRTRRPRRSVTSRARTVVGELLVTSAVLAGLYLLWLLWWTDVQAEEVHEEIVASLEWAQPSAPPADRPRKEPGPGPAIAEPADGETFAVLHVPRWGYDYARPVTQGVDRATVLDPKGIGHYPGTAMPGQVGNFAVAAHRVTYGKPFNRVAELQVGDPLIVQTEDAWYVYRVTSSDVVLPGDVEVIAPNPGDPTGQAVEEIITLTTCHPMFSARERFIVHGILDYWWPATSGTPAELTGQEA